MHHVHAGYKPPIIKHNPPHSLAESDRNARKITVCISGMAGRWQAAVCFDNASSLPLLIQGQLPKHSALEGQCLKCVLQSVQRAMQAVRYRKWYIGCERGIPQQRGRGAARGATAGMVCALSARAVGTGHRMAPPPRDSLGGDAMGARRGVRQLHRMYLRVACSVEMEA